MNAWLTIISAFFQLITMILKNKFEKDAQKKKEKDTLHAEANEAIKSGDLSRINTVFNRLRSN